MDGVLREQWDVLESPEGDECWLLVLREESDRGGRIITPVYEIFLWLAPAAGAVIGAPFVQTLASRAGDSAFAFLRDRFQRHRRTRDHPPDMQILIARSLDNRMTLEIPGDITEEALQAFIDQVPELLADAPGVEDIRIGLRDGRRWERREG
ncbi:MAG: hypothetical protein HOZ81_39115 [Streptomyces sp.]|nr:hypothetical protein [Streptomyces sp.]